VLCCLDVIIGFDKKPLDAGLNVLSYVSSLSEGVAVTDREGYVYLFA
jgi:hypothetical protein